MVQAYRDMVVLLFPPLPPPAVQRVVMPLLARLGERRGYRAGRMAEGRAVTLPATFDRHEKDH